MAFFSLFDTEKKMTIQYQEKLILPTLELFNLRKKVNDLAFTIETLWELLVEHNDFNESALQEKVIAKKNEIESRAGETTTCRSCNKTVPTNKKSCYYCGANLS